MKFACKHFSWLVRARHRYMPRGARGAFARQPGPTASSLGPRYCSYVCNYSSPMRGFNFSICTHRNRFSPVPSWHRPLLGIRFYYCVLFIKYQEIERIERRYRWVSTKDIIINFDSLTFVTEDRGLSISLWRKRTCNISLVPENKDKPRLFIGEIGGWYFAFTR